jgi:hypothetical protein
VKGIEQLDEWLQVHARLEAELAATRSQETQALADSSGDRTERSKRISAAQTGAAVLAADLEHHAKGEKKLVDALCAAIRYGCQ